MSAVVGLAIALISLPAAGQGLLLSEVVVTPTDGEYVEIHNPTAVVIELDDVYLTDATSAGDGVYYYNIVTGSSAGGGDESDFHARFPDGATIGPDEYQTVAIAGSDAFFARYGFEPDYELYEGAEPDAVPDMREALPGSIDIPNSGLSNSGEVVILYLWDGESDLVTDLDYALWGDRAEAVDKTGVTIDGLDPDGSPTSYLPDTAIAAQDVVASFAHGFGAAFHRVDLTEGEETQTGGNGMDGSDETSEDLSVTWSTGNAPTPGEPAPEPQPPTGWIINEIHADPAPGLAGDANGDGVRDSSHDEFIEIVNISGAAVNMSGFVLADGLGVRHLFPVGTVIADGCGVVVFGGGAPTGDFGFFTVQTANMGALGLDNLGDTVALYDSIFSLVTSVTYGPKGGTDQSLTRDPDLIGGFVPHSAAGGSGGSLYSPATRADGTHFDGCGSPQPLEIFDIQGVGASSLHEGRVVRSEDNVVTCLAPDGFFMQTPAARTDGDVDTSDGIFVYTGAAPTVAVGDLVDVTAMVHEHFGMTELNSIVELTVDGAVSPPPPVVFDEVVPSPDPTAPSCAIEYECYEGMLVEISGGTVSGPNQWLAGDPIAEVHVVAGSERAMREAGVAYPGLPDLPVFDGNPEVFELDPDRLGLPNRSIPAGSTFDAVGVIAFELGGYELWPQQLSITEADIPRPVWQRQPGEITVGTLNLNRLYDDVDDPPSEDALGGGRDDTVVSTTEYVGRRGKLASHILGVLDAPDILAVQEAEKIEVLQVLAADIEALDPSVAYTAFLEEGNDPGTIDVGLLVREDVIQVDAVTQLGKGETFIDPVTGGAVVVHDRPPLLLQAGGWDSDDDAFQIYVMVVHNRSFFGVGHPDRGPFVRGKRLQQANSIASKVQAIQNTEDDDDDDGRLVVIGDFNAFEFSDGYVDVVGRIAGDFDDDDDLVFDPTDHVDPDLANPIETLIARERYSSVFRGTCGAVDHVLTSASLASAVAGVDFGRGNADAAVDLRDDPTTPLRASDHDGLVLFIATDGDADADGVPDAGDVCAGTVIPESVPTVELRPNRWALVDDDGIFDTRGVPGPVRGNHRSYSIWDTAGCSCEQIIEELDLGSGHTMFGCSGSAMDRWIDLVQP